MEKVRKFYNEYASREWERLEKSPVARLIYYLHERFLAQDIRNGHRILDAGCGNGRFSIYMAQHGALLTLLDVSEVQLDLAKQRIEEASVQNQLERCIVAGISDLSIIHSSTFDTVVCFGGVLNYTGNETGKALAELKRVTKKGGTIFLSVITLYGGLLRYMIANPDSLESAYFSTISNDRLELVLKTGNVPEIDGHPERHFFSVSEMSKILPNAGLQIVDMACAPSLLTGVGRNNPEFFHRQQFSNNFIALEEQLFKSPSMLDQGEFLLIKCIKQ